jgi:hypothetical protein
MTAETISDRQLEIIEAAGKILTAIRCKWFNN